MGMPIVEIFDCFIIESSNISRSRWLSQMLVRLANRNRRFDPRRARQHSLVEIDHEIFSTFILSFPLIQEGQLSISGERMCSSTG